MKSLLTPVLALVAAFTFAQTATISGRFPAGRYNRITLNRPAMYFMWGSLEERTSNIPLQSNRFKYTPSVSEGEIMEIQFSDSTGLRDTSYNLFLLPGYNLSMQIDDNGKLAVTGKGSADNQPLGLIKYDSVETFYGDTLPDRSFNYMMRVQQQNRDILRQFIKDNKDLSKEYIRTMTTETDYSGVANFFAFQRNNRFQVKKAYARNKTSWDKRIEESYGGLALSNDKAVGTRSYQLLLNVFLLSNLTSARDLAWTDRALFLQTYYPDDTSSGWKKLMDDTENQLGARIIEKTLTGAAKEYGYAALFESAFHDAGIMNLVTIYNEFKRQFPDSRYRRFFDGRMAIVARKHQLPLNDKMVFIEKGNSINSLQEVLAKMKGKTVLLDMWGTWCGPCRVEMNKHGDAIKKHFAGKGLDYLYIANRDEEAGEKWKQLIAFYNLEGYHILANQRLTKDIMDNIESSSFPTYAIIDRDGKIEVYKAGYPLDRDALISQVENVLARPTTGSVENYHRPDVE